MLTLYNIYCHALLIDMAVIGAVYRWPDDGHFNLNSYIC